VKPFAAKADIAYTIRWNEWSKLTGMPKNDT
jgi:hypothetical protein